MKKIHVLIALLLWGTTSCSDFLEPDSPSEYVPETADALNEMLLGDAYAKSDNNYFLFPYHNILDDDVEMTNEPITVTQSMTEFASLYSWDPNMHEEGMAVDVWENYYRFILGCNAALDYLDDVSGSADEKNYVAAQAHALRAFYYFNLVNLFGEPYGHDKNALGVPLKVTSDLTDGYDARNTVGEVYEQILSDLTDAEECFLALPEDKRHPESYRMLLEECYPGLRRSDYVVTYIIRGFNVDEARQIIRTQPQKLSLQEMFAVAQTYEPGSEDFKQVFDVAVHLYPNDPVANLNAANSLLEIGQYDLAQPYLNKAGQSPQALNARAVALLMQSRYDEALPLLRQAREAGLKEAEANMKIYGAAGE